jgi:hypothetical protein
LRQTIRPSFSARPQISAATAAFLSGVVGNDRKEVPVGSRTAEDGERVTGGMVRQTDVLSARGLLNVPRHEWRNDFEFIVGSAHYRCPALIADFLSPRIARLHSVDDTITTFNVTEEDEHSAFSQFLDLGYGRALVLNERNQGFLVSICEELGNLELCELIFRMAEGDISSSNVAPRIRSLGRLGSRYDDEISFSASIFLRCRPHHLNHLIMIF